MTTRDADGNRGTGQEAEPGPPGRPLAAARQRKAGATPFAVGFSMTAWREQHLYGLFSSLGYLWRRRRSTLLTVCVMALALLLPLLLQVVLRNLEDFGDGLRDAREISVFLQPRLALAEVEAANSTISQAAGVVEVRMRTPADGLDELRALEGFEGAAALLDDNPLPHVLLVAPAAGLDDGGMRALAAQLGKLPGVDFVQFELAWRDRLGRVLAFARRMALIAGVLFALAALLVVGNTIRLDVAARSREISVVQLLGGTDGFVRRPFLYAGVWYGLGAGLLAVIVASVLIGFAREPTLALAADYARQFELRGVSATLAVAALAGGAMLGWLGAWAACTSWLARGRPR